MHFSIVLGLVLELLSKKSVSGETLTSLLPDLLLVELSVAMRLCPIAGPGPYSYPLTSGTAVPL